MKDLVDYVAAHRLRISVTVFVVWTASVVGVAWTLREKFDSQHAINVASCKQVNELRRSIYVAFTDFGVPLFIRDRFLPTENCEDLP